MNAPIASSVPPHPWIVHAEEEITFVASQGYFSVRPAREFFNAHPERYADLAGAEISYVGPRLGWQFTAQPWCVMAMDPDGQAQAMGWAACTDRGEHGGINLSYATAPHMQGRGLALLTVSLALLHLAKTCDIPPGASVHAQFDEGNPRSGAVAARLGLQPDRLLSAEVHIPASPLGLHPERTRRFLGMSAPWQLVSSTARQFAGDAEIVTWEDYDATGEEAPQWPRSRMN